MTKLTDHFTREELACRCGCGKMELPPGFLKKLEDLRVALNRPMHISSGYRCPEYNARISGTGENGPHTQCAVDVRVAGTEAYTLIQMALHVGFTGIGVSQRGAHGSRFIHLDDLPGPAYPRPTVWSY